jgi:mannose-1-phosphate guanylyltransferase/mannose-6-phosphate isomerase
MSRSHHPKQFLCLNGDESLLQQTLARLRGATECGIEIGDPVVVCNEEHRFMVAEQARVAEIPLAGIMLEPVGRNTAPALTAAAAHAAQVAADPILIMMPADHVISRLDIFRKAVRVGVAHARESAIVTFGIVPERPETGYGYIKVRGIGSGAGGDSSQPRGHPLEGFVEKPDAATAQSYLDAGCYFWNSGIFMMRASIWLAAIQRYRPDIAQAARQAVALGRREGDFFRLDPEAFSACPGDSVDYAVMEHIGRDGAVRGIVVSLDAGWSDVGSWSSLWEVAAKDTAGNLLRGDVCAIDSRDNLVFAGHRLVATVGCRDLTIVETADSVMVAPRSHSQQVKKLVDWLEREGRSERIHHRRLEHAWGSFEAIENGPSFRVNRITLRAGKSVSAHVPAHATSHWVVTTGTCKLDYGAEEIVIEASGSACLYGEASCVFHNRGDAAAEIIEVQLGCEREQGSVQRFR